MGWWPNHTVGYIALTTEKKAEDNPCISQSKSNFLEAAGEPEGCT